MDRQFDDAGDEVIVKAHGDITGDSQETVVTLAGEPSLNPGDKSIELGNELFMTYRSQILAALANRNVEGGRNVGIEVREVHGGRDRLMVRRLGTVEVGVNGECGAHQVAGETVDRKLGQCARLIPPRRHLACGYNGMDGSKRREKGATRVAYSGLRGAYHRHLYMLVSDADGLLDRLGLLEHAKHALGDIGA